MAEQAAHNRLVEGSNPSGPTFLLIYDFGRKPHRGMLAESLLDHFLLILDIG